MTRGQVRRRAERPSVTVVAAGDRVIVEGIKQDELQIIAMAHGIDHRRDGKGWTFAPEDALRLAAALRAAGPPGAAGIRARVMTALAWAWLIVLPLLAGYGAGTAVHDLVAVVRRRRLRRAVGQQVPQMPHVTPVRSWSR